MRVGAADVPVHRLVKSQCVYVTVGTTRTAMKEIVLMTTLPLYSTHDTKLRLCVVYKQEVERDQNRFLVCVCTAL